MAHTPYTPSTADQAALLTEWLEHLHTATRFGSSDPAAIADVLTFGSTVTVTPTTTTTAQEVN